MKTMCIASQQVFENSLKVFSNKAAEKDISVKNILNKCETNVAKHRYASVMACSAKKKGYYRDVFVLMGRDDCNVHPEQE